MNRLENKDRFGKKAEKRIRKDKAYWREEVDKR